MSIKKRLAKIEESLPKEDVKDPEIASGDGLPIEIRREVIAAADRIQRETGKLCERLSLKELKSHLTPEAYKALKKVSRKKR